jgi:hypothetical protein
VVLLIARVGWARREKGSVLAEMIPFAAVIAVLAGLEGVNYVLFLRPVLLSAAHAGLLRDWMASDGFPPYGPKGSFAWVWRSLRGILGGTATMWLSASDLAMFTAIVGLAGMLLAEKLRTRGALIFSTLPLAVAAAFMRKYPFADRLALYAVPIMTLLIAAGIDFLWGKDDSSPQGWKRMAVGLLIGVMIIGDPMMRAIYVARNPGGREETKGLFEWIRRNWRTGDALFISHMGRWSFDYYAPKTGMAGLEELWPSAPQEHGEQPTLESSLQGAAAEPWFVKAFTPAKITDSELSGYVILQPDHSGGPGSPANPALYLDDIDHLFNPAPEWRWPPVKRVWVVFAHDWDEQLAKLCVPELDRRARQSIQHTEDGASVYLYEMTDTPSAYMRQ